MSSVDSSTRLSTNSPQVPLATEPAGAGAGNPAVLRRAAKSPPPLPAEKASRKPRGPILAAPTDGETGDLTFAQRVRKWLHDYRRELSAYALSTAVQVLALVVLGLITLDETHIQELLSIIATTTEDLPEIEEQLVVVDQPEVLNDLAVDAMPTEVNSPHLTENSKPFELNINDLEPSIQVEDTTAPGPSVKIDLKSDVGGRSEAGRAALVKQFGGTEASEAAVASGLKWLARHQNSDGSWSFDHVHDEACKASCTQPGSLDSKTGGTAMALLAFLGAGQTHESGQYQEVVKKGINFLLGAMKTSKEGVPGDLRGEDYGHAGMYIQGLAAIAICEAHALTKDRRLRQASMYALNFIIQAQDQKGGGWRYTPGQAGDTSVVGWQLMALKSGQAARIPIAPTVFHGVTKFLDYVQADGGAQYGYTDPATGRQATTAVGLLCRMYLGWKRDNEALQRGVALLSKWGPLRSNMYYNYYATQVLHHWGGEEWTRWNEVMREQLIRTQERSGHAEGSWPPADAHGGQGGRLYMTCMAIMTLEVYYRHLPLYHRENIAVEF